ncbi:MAG TPA: UDP-N-acetylmuramate dehydrogenase [Vicinamibacterales bacterium]|jgi:UDP-N-acetylmuramate dehydrogenase
MSWTEAIDAAFGPERLREYVPLAPLTTFRVGGPADWLLEVRDGDELARAVTLARGHGLPVTILGGGSNVLVSDAGIRGVVVRPKGGHVGLDGGSQVRADAGVLLNSVVRWTIGRGLAGLEAWAGTPGTVGGAVFGNAHYGGHSIGDLVQCVRLLAPDGRIAEVPARDLGFAYDRSRLQETGEIALSVTFLLRPGADPADLREIARRSLAHRKRTQPLHTPSAGCIFQNPDPARDRLPEGIPPSAGALVDRAGLKGHAIGGARVSTTHANFIVNEGGATAADIWALMTLCRRTVRERFGVELREEIRCVGRQG